MANELIRQSGLEMTVPNVKNTELEIKEDLLSEAKRLVGYKMPDEQPIFGRGSPGRLLKTVNSMLAKSQPITLTHSVTVGHILGAFLKEYYDLPSFVGEAIGQVHDCGKLQMTEIINKKGKLTDRELEEIKKHPLFSLIFLESGDYPTIGRIVLGHHLYGQPNRYPEDYREENLFIRELQIILSIIDKLVAGIDIRPELSQEDLYNRMTTRQMLSKCNKLLESYSDLKRDYPIQEWFEFLKNIISQGLRINGNIIRIGDAVTSKQIKELEAIKVGDLIECLT